jgi:hypothetical protein
MKVRDRSQANVGGVLTGHSTVTPPTPNPNAENGESKEAEHQPGAMGLGKTYSVAIAPELMRAHQASSITCDDSNRAHGKTSTAETNRESRQAQVAPAGYGSGNDEPNPSKGDACADVQAILGKSANGAVVARPVQSAFSNTILRDATDGQAPLHKPVTAHLGSHPHEAHGEAIYKG